jgi:CHAT domain-containing protein
VRRAEALREARTWVRNWRAPDGSRPFAHPCYWAAFILIGDAG